MKPLIKYMILLLAGVIFILLYQYTGAVKTAPVITPPKKAEQKVQSKRENLHKFSFVRDAAAKLIPVLKYF